MQMFSCKNRQVNRSWDLPALNERVRTATYLSPPLCDWIVTQASHQ